MSAAPPLWMTLFDTPRGLLEQACFRLVGFPERFTREHGALDGDGAPVMLIPGLGADEWQMWAMRDQLRALGFAAATWGMGRNWGSRTVGGDGQLLMDRLVRVALAAQRKVTLIGWSLGGLQARLLGGAAPELVERVITLGSPFNGPRGATNIGALYALLTGQRLTPDLEHRLAAPLPVPALSIYSRSDGIVGWRGCVDPTGTTAHAEVSGAHTGLATNPRALTAACLFMRGPL